MIHISFLLYIYIYIYCTCIVYSMYIICIKMRWLKWNLVAILSWGFVQFFQQASNEEVRCLFLLYFPVIIWYTCIICASFLNNHNNICLFIFLLCLKSLLVDSRTCLLHLFHSLWFSPLFFFLLLSWLFKSP